MMTCEIRIKKEDPDVKSENKGMTKFVTTPADFSDLQDWVSDEEWVDTPHNTSIKPCKKVKPDECHKSQGMSTESRETSTIHQYSQLSSDDNPTSPQDPETFF